MYSDRGVNDRVLINVHDSRDAWIGSTLSSEHILTNTIEVRGPPRKSRAEKPCLAYWTTNITLSAARRLQKKIWSKCVLPDYADRSLITFYYEAQTDTTERNTWTGKIVFW